MNIVQQTSTAHTGYLKGRAIKYIVLHYTAGTSSKKGTARGVAAMFAHPNSRPASADYIIDDGEIVQYNGDIANRYTYAVGGDRYTNRYTPLSGTFYGKCKNNNSISIEMCSSKVNKQQPLNALDTDWSISASVVDKAVELVSYLMDKYNIPPDRVVMHHHVTGKLCPQPWCLNTKRLAGWEAFKARLTDGKEEPDMTEKEVRDIIGNLSDEAAYQLVSKALRYIGEKPEPDWSRDDGQWEEAARRGITDGTRPCALTPRVEVVAMISRALDQLNAVTVEDLKRLKENLEQAGME